MSNDDHTDGITEEKPVLQSAEECAHSRIPYVIMLVGCVLCLIAYYSLNIFVNDVFTAENERITKQFIYSSFQNAQDIEDSIESIVGFIELPNYMDQADFQKFVKVEFDHNLLDRFYYAALYHERDGQGYLSRLSTQDVQGDLEALEAVLSQANLQGGAAKGPQISMQDGLLKVFEANGMTPLVFVSSVDVGFADKAWLITVSPFDSLFDNNFIAMDSISLMAVRDMGLNTQVYNHVGRAETFMEKPYPLQIHQLSFGNHQFEIQTQFFKTGVVLLMDFIPYLGMGLVFFLTVLLVIYAHNQDKQSARIDTMNKVLEDKNKALKLEMEKREALNSDLKKSEHENREVIDSISDIIFETDPTGALTYVNAAWPRITGFTVMQSMGKNLFSLLYPDDQKKEQEHFDSLVKGQKSAYRTFSRLRTIDGTFRAIEMSISMMRRTSDGRLHVVGAITDVEERRRAERALGEAEKRYREIVENAAWGIYQMTPEGIYLSANPSLVKILGYDSADEMLHKIRNAHDQVYGNDKERKSVLREVDVKGAINNHEVQIYDRQGRGLWVNENIRAVKDDAGNVLYYEGSLEDITTRKEADLMLREAKMHSDMANRAKSEFLTNMSHELRTPLNAIIGFSDIMRSESFGPIGHESYKEYVTDIHNSGKNLLNIINEILDISKIEVQERELNESLVDVGEVMKACLALLGNKIQANQTEILNMIDKAPLVVAEDRAMKQIFTNILSNAIKFTPRGGRVTLKHDVNKAGDLLISVTDNGVGLDPEEIKKALSPFGQVGSSLDAENAGTGLGLTLVKSLVELHNGKLEIFSQKGMGTTVTVKLPAKRVQHDAPVEARTPESAAPESFT